MSASDYSLPPSVEILYCDHYDWLQGWLRRHLGNAADAADLAHDTFLRLLTTLRRFDSLPEARGYLRTMADGLCIDLWRRKKARRCSGLFHVCPKRQSWRGFRRSVRKVRAHLKPYLCHKLHKNEAERTLYSLFVQKAVSHVPYINQHVAKGSLNRDLACEGDRVEIMRRARP